MLEQVLGLRAIELAGSGHGAMVLRVLHHEGFHGGGPAMVWQGI